MTDDHTLAFHGVLSEQARAILTGRVTPEPDPAARALGADDPSRPSPAVVARLSRSFPIGTTVKTTVLGAHEVTGTVDRQDTAGLHIKTETGRVFLAWSGLAAAQFENREETA